MRDYKWLHEYCLNRFGSAAELEAHLPVPKTPRNCARSATTATSTMALRVFRAGLKHSLVDAKWPAFEEVFFKFDPEKVVLMSAEHLERLMQDARIIRHLGKLKSVPRNAQFILDVEQEKGSFGALIADWPVTDIVGLWTYLKTRSQLGGLSAPRFLRMVGKDTFVPSYDVVAALNAQKIVDKAPTSLRDLAIVQNAFNQWHEQSGGRPMSQISMMLAYTVNH
jgi:3-methyladenine DNA glycosylase Tag